MATILDIEKSATELAEKLSKIEMLSLKLEALLAEVSDANVKYQDLVEFKDRISELKSEIEITLEKITLHNSEAKTKLESLDLRVHDATNSVTVLAQSSKDTVETLGKLNDETIRSFTELSAKSESLAAGVTIEQKTQKEQVERNEAAAKKRFKWIIIANCGVFATLAFIVVTYFFAK